MKCFSNFADTWLQPGIKSKEKREPFERLFFMAETVETVLLVFLSLHLAKARC